MCWLYWSGILSLQVSLVVEKALGDLWVQLPCIDQLGSCTYNDVCTIIDNLIPPGTPCPEPLLTYGIPCHCPFKAVCPKHWRHRLRTTVGGFGWRLAYMSPLSAGLLLPASQ